MYDAIVIGGGPGGYVCAISIAKKGGKVCLIEKNGLGGTCTQRGCIPTKYLHSMADIIRKAKNAKKFGISADIELDYEVLAKRMHVTVSKLAKGIQMLLEKNSVEVIEGTGKIKSKNEVVVGEKSLQAKNIVIASGSTYTGIPNFEFDDFVLSTDAVFELTRLPESVIVVGGGYSGCEFASILNALGSKVWLVEMEDRLLPWQPEIVGRTVEKYMKLDGIKVKTSSKVDKTADGKISINDEIISPEKMLVCSGRRPNFSEDECKKIGIDFDEKGIKVNEKMQTSIPNIYAIGDVTGMFELAHVSTKQGEIAANNISGIEDKMEYSTIPFCVFTYPEVAIVGRCEGKEGEFPLSSNAKASCLGENRGFVKVFEKDGALSGAIIVAPHASEFLGEVTLAVKMKVRCTDIIDTIHAHPSLPEAFVDAVRDVQNDSIHMPPK